MKAKVNYFFNNYPKSAMFSLIVMFVVVEGIFSFCSKVKCAAFSDSNYDVWFPYQKSQSIYFNSSMGKKDTMLIESTDKSEAYEHYNLENRGCYINASITSANPKSKGYKLYIYCTLGEVSKNLSFQVYNTSFSATDISDQGLKLNDDPRYSAKFYNTLQIQGKSFSQVQALQRDTTLTGSYVYKAWIAKNIGLVAFEDYPSKELWVKQP